MLAQSSFYSANDLRLHFGLGAAASADLEIRWPNGAVERIANVDADQLVVVREGKGIERRQRFGRYGVSLADARALPGARLGVGGDLGWLAARRAGGEEPGARHLRGRLLLEHGGAFRQGPGSRLDDGGLRRWNGGEPDVPAGRGRRDRARRGGAGRLRSGKVAYDKLLEVFWHNIDPFDAGGQFCDRGRQYRTEIFYEGDDQLRAAQATKDVLERSHLLPAPIATQIAPLRAFYPAEPEHQDFYQRNVRRYWQYRTGCGRDERLKLIWGK